MGNVAEEASITSSLPVSELLNNASTDISEPSVAVLLCTHQGSQFLAEQLDSIHSQKHSNLSIWASDDSSDNDTHQILEQYQSQWGQERLSIHSGPQEGFVANFFSLTCYSDIEADYFAYADQDDIWEPNKLSRAIAKLESVPDEIPALYCSRTQLIDESGEYIDLSPMFNKPPSFVNALTQNIASGNTMVMNKTAREILRLAGEKNIVSHDWWAYIVISAVGGTVIYDTYPTVRYRQHDNNIVGLNSGWRARLLRLHLLFKDRFKHCTNKNIQALQDIKHLITPKNQITLDKFCMARNRWLIPRLLGMWKLGIYRQTLAGNLSLIAAIILKKI